MDVKRNSIELLSIKNYDGSRISLDSYISAEVELICYEIIDRTGTPPDKEKIKEITEKLLNSYIEKEIS